MKLIKFFLVVLIAVNLYGCASSKYASIRNRQHLKAPLTYIVKPKDTLYSIAWRYGLDYREVATINNINGTYHIRSGQKLRLVPPRYKNNKVTASSLPSMALATAQYCTIAWMWPAQGKIINNFSEYNFNKGIDIAGIKNSSVLAAAGGKVVYSSNGLRGYGNLIIIKHNDEYLSAYAHNEKLLAHEGQNIQAGEMIAKMGDTDAKRVMLHFEIRRAGKPVDPLQFLPPR